MLKTGWRWRIVLQWGRAYKSAELSCPTPPPPIYAPLQWGRAYKSAEFRHPPRKPTRRQSASMGPRLQERGVSAETLMPINSLIMLQWGRAYKSAELSAAPAKGSAAPALQWGRAYKSAELEMQVIKLVLQRKASMGPRLQERGVSLIMQALLPVISVLQWGRAYKSAEFATGGKTTIPPAMASMGPRLQERGVTTIPPAM